MRGTELPAFGLFVRGVLAATIFALLLAGSALAAPDREDPSGDSMPGVAPGNLGQHGPDTGHLPPVQKNMDLVSKLELTGRFGDVVEGQIADVAVYKGFAYLNSWATEACDRGGTYIVDIRDPASPKEVGFLDALPQNYHGEGAHVITINTPQFSGDVLAVNNEWCTGTDPDRGGGMDLYDVTDPTKPKLLGQQGFGDFGDNDNPPSLTGTRARANSSHSVFMWTSGTGANAKAYAVQVDNEETYDVDIFDITNPSSPQPVAEYDLTASPFGEQIWTETANGDNPFLHDMVVKQIGDKMVMLASYWDAGYVQLDVTDPANATVIADTDFGTIDPLTGFAPPEGNAHQAEWTAGNEYIATGEEDFAPYRLISVTVEGVGDFAAAAVGGGAPPEALDDGVLNGPMAYGGYACDASEDVPDAETLFPRDSLEPDEERILVVQRGPAGDTDDTYEGCFPGEKAANADEAGWDAILITNRHLGSAEDDNPFCGSGGYDRLVVTGCTTHEALHAIFDDAPEYEVPYDDDEELVPVGTVSPHELTAQGTFDGWGYMSLYSNTPDADGKLPLVDTYAIPEALNPAYALGFGDLSIHEQAADPTEPLTYASYYAGGMRVFSVAGGNIGELGAFIDEGGSNFWGVEQFTQNGERYIAGSDRDYGLYLFRYTGPGAAKRPVCSDAVVAVPFKGSATVPLPCSDANDNPLTRRVVTAPSKGVLTEVDQAAGTVTYTHTGESLGTDQFTFTASDGAAEAEAATVRIVIVGTSGGACFNLIVGSDASETLVGSSYGDRIRAGRGDDRASGRSGADCLTGQGGSDRLRGDGGKDRVSGGSGDDRIWGGSRRDRLRGGGGNDRIDGGPGRNRIWGGPGRDVVDAVNGKRDRIKCGKGEDSVRADRKDRVSGSCEIVRRS
jgi:hypothetical protein